MRIFISYSRVNQEWVLELWKRIRLETDHTAWIDQAPTGIVGGVNWWHDIVDNIEKSACLLFIESTASVKSIYCQAEVSYASALNVPVIPLTLEACEHLPELINRQIQHQPIATPDNWDAVMRVVERSFSKIEKLIAQGAYTRFFADKPALPIQNVSDVDQFVDGFRIISVNTAEWSTLDSTKPVDIQSLNNCANILDEPFSWVQIPQGRLEVEEMYTVEKREADVWSDWVSKYTRHTILHVPAFYISQYPITNAQFRAFMEHEGYQTEKWWTQLGWDAKQSQNWSKPAFFAQDKFNNVNQPVVGISWYEATAFCRWLTELTKCNVTLPYEQQWQRAAQGDVSSAYPWGDEWNENACNHSVDNWQSVSTSPVTLFKQVGSSSFDVVDMAGNVWEWCKGASRHEMPIRGGSWWHNNKEFFKCSYRTFRNPLERRNYLGFRIAAY